ncbi:hypothetical protein FACS1894137_04180 [Spirochaetia bacterium]|nr:hypothetical protein FACS1894137_04180 [Spirochaetia bacterium]
MADESFPEGQVLGCILSGADIPAAIEVGMFASGRNRIVFKALSLLKERVASPDLTILVPHLRGTGELEDAGGQDYIASLTTGIVPAQIQYFTDTLIKRHRDRKYETAIKHAAENLGKDPTEWIVQSLQKTLDADVPDAVGGFRFDRIGAMEMKPSSWLVKGLIETDSFGCLFGDPGAGKSFLAIELAACVATGTPFYGLEVKRPGPVIYLAGEGRAGLIRRFNAWSIARRIPIKDAPLFLNSGAVSLIEDISMVSMVKALKTLIKELGRPPALVILDTWSRTLGGDDSAPSDAAAGVAALDALRARFENFAALVVHHEGHLKGRGRGWSGLRAAVDVEIRADRGKDDLLRLECTKSKDTKPIEPMAFQFFTVELGLQDEDGNPVTSAVLNEVEWTPAQEAGSKKAMGKNQTIALDILRRLENEARKNRGDEGRVLISVWRDGCSDAGMDKYRIRDSRKTLEENGLIEVYEKSFIKTCPAAIDVAVCGVAGGLLYNPPPQTATGGGVGNGGGTPQTATPPPENQHRYTSPEQEKLWQTGEVF